MSSLPVSDLTRSIVELLTEAYVGPPDANSPTWFNDNDPNAGIFGQVRYVTSAEASFSADKTGNPGTTVASHIEHLRWSLENANGAMNGEPYQSNWKASWTVTAVNDQGWNELRQQLHTEFEAICASILKQEQLAGEYLNGLMATCAACCLSPGDHTPDSRTRPRRELKDGGSMNLNGQTVLITGSARRIGRALALYLAQAGADIFIHHGSSPEDADKTAVEIRNLGRKAWVVQADLADPEQVTQLVERAWEIQPFQHLVNNAAQFESLQWDTTTPANWQKTFNINLTAPFFLSQQLGLKLAGKSGRILNLLDWRALRPGADHLPYTISKAALAALT